jgi:hypothetical protein
MKSLLVFASALFVVGCATTSGGDYAQVYDRKYNEWRLVQQERPGDFVGTAARQPARSAGQHP